MLTALLSPRTYLINGTTYEVDQAMALTMTETALLAKVADLTKSINALRTQVFEGCWNGTSEIDAELSSQYYKFEDQRFAHNTATTKLLRGICRRIGGVLPMHVQATAEPFQVIVRAQQQGEPVTIDRGLVKSGSLYSRAIGDIEAMLPVFLGTEDQTVIKSHVDCAPGEWRMFGAPGVSIATSSIGLDINYAKGLPNFLWTDHENVQLDRLVTLGVGRILGQPGRLQSMQSRAHPFPMIATIVGPETTHIINLSEASEGHDGFRLALLKREVEALDGRFLFLTQFGPLEQSGSQVDMQNGPNAPMGITVTAVVSNGDGILMGGKSWTIQQADPKAAPSLMTYGVFEDHPGLAGNNPQGVIANIFAGTRKAPALALVTETVVEAVADPADVVAPIEKKRAKKATKRAPRKKVASKKADSGTQYHEVDPLSGLDD